MLSEHDSHRGRRIGIVSYDYDPPIGGLGVLVKTYVDELQKLHVEDTYTVISPSAHADEHGSHFGRARYRKSGGCPLFSLSLLFSLTRIIRRCQCDLLHVHSGSGGVFLLRRPPCKLIVTAHHTYRQEADLVFMRSPLKKLLKLFMALLESRTYHMADIVVCVSKDTAQEIISQYSVPASRVCVIENPVQVAEAESLRAQPTQKNTIVFVGRLEHRKGIIVLLEAFCILKKNIPDARLRLIGSNLIGSHLTSVIEKLGLKDAVTILGYVQNSDRFREMAQATAIVIPSLLEGFGLVAAEAMVLGTCVIASDVPGLRSIISDNHTGLLFPVGHVSALAETMKRVLTDTNLRQTLENAALAEAPQRFSVERRTHDQSDVYSRFLVQ